jgi:predicted helicase
MPTTPQTITTLAHHLAHLAHRLQQAIVPILSSDTGDAGGMSNQQSTQTILHTQLAALRQTLLPTITAGEFADMYAQTLVYGLFAARVTSPDAPTFTRYDITQALPHMPLFLPELFSLCTHPNLDERIGAVIDDCAHLLQDTDMTSILHPTGNAPKQEDPITYFYEHFLAAYDPKTREKRGVYYTPEPVVGYLVRSVDWLLQTHFGKRMGLADEDTLILDPATGTATFLHAIIQHIYATIQRQGMATSWQTYVPEKLLPRLHGFELLMAPYTIAHLKLRMLLQQLGYTFGTTGMTGTTGERLGIYLTNALTNPPLGSQTSPLTQSIANETQAPNGAMHANDNTVLVIVGNPPYANVGMLNKETWIQQQLETYKRGLQEKKLNLDDDYIKFIRYGQWRIEQAGQGILAFITNNTYLDGITHRRMRESLLETFTHMYLLDLHGGIRKKEVSPDGQSDENLFTIRQGVAIGLFVKAPNTPTATTVFHAEMWGRRATKYATLATTNVATTAWEQLHPAHPWFFFVPKQFAVAHTYTQHPTLTDIFPLHQNAIKTDRDSLFFAQDAAVLAERMQTFYSPAGLQSPFQERYRVENSSSYPLLSRRENTTYNASSIHRALYRPFDLQWLYYAPQITSRAAWEVMRHILVGNNLVLLGMRQYDYAVQDYCYVLVTEHITESRVFISNRGGASLFPLYVYPPEATNTSGCRRPNLSAPFIANVEQQLGLSFIPDGSGDLATTIGPEDIFHYLYAVLHNPHYRSRYAELLKIDFPRVPITSNLPLVKTLVDYGATLVDLHLLRLPGSMGVGGGEGAAVLVHPADQGVTQQGVTTAPVQQVRYDKHTQRVWLGGGMFFAGIESTTWAVQVGGYYPLYKWLKDRKGQTLSAADALHYMRMVVALRETRRIMEEIAAIAGDNWR